MSKSTAIKELERFKHEMETLEEINLMVISDAHTSTSSLMAYVRLDMIKNTKQRICMIIDRIETEEL